jgi:hypothetical protein
MVVIEEIGGESAEGEDYAAAADSFANDQRSCRRRSKKSSKDKQMKDDNDDVNDDDDDNNSAGEEEESSSDSDGESNGSDDDDDDDEDVEKGGGEKQVKDDDDDDDVEDDDDNSSEEEDGEEKEEEEGGGDEDEAEEVKQPSRAEVAAFANQGSSEPCTFDLRNLLAMNGHQVDVKALYSTSKNNKKADERVTISTSSSSKTNTISKKATILPNLQLANEEYLLEKATQGCNQLVRALWQLPIEPSDAGPMARLPLQDESRIPRALVCSILYTTYCFWIIFMLQTLWLPKGYYPSCPFWKTRNSHVSFSLFVSLQYTYSHHRSQNKKPSGRNLPRSVVLVKTRKNDLEKCGTRERESGCFDMDTIRPMTMSTNNGPSWRLKEIKIHLKIPGNDSAKPKRLASTRIPSSTCAIKNALDYCPKAPRIGPARVAKLLARQGNKEVTWTATT